MRTPKLLPACLFLLQEQSKETFIHQSVHTISSPNLLGCNVICSWERTEKRQICAGIICQLWTFPTWRRENCCASCMKKALKKLLTSKAICSSWKRLIQDLFGWKNQKKKKKRNRAYPSSQYGFSADKHSDPIETTCAVRISCISGIAISTVL